MKYTTTQARKLFDKINAHAQTMSIAKAVKLEGVARGTYNNWLNSRFKDTPSHTVNPAITVHDAPKKRKYNRVAPYSSRSVFSAPHKNATPEKCIIIVADINSLSGVLRGLS